MDEFAGYHVIGQIKQKDGSLKFFEDHILNPPWEKWTMPFNGYIIAYLFSQGEFHIVEIPERLSHQWRALNAQGRASELAAHHGYDEGSLLLVSDWNSGTLVPVRVTKTNYSGQLVRIEVSSFDC